MDQSRSIPAAPPPLGLDEVQWEAIKATTDVTTLRGFLARHGTSRLRVDAEARIRALEEATRKPAAVPPPSPPQMFASNPVDPLPAELPRNELTVVLSKSLNEGEAEVLAEAKVPAAREKATSLVADGQRALALGNADRARKAIADLEALRADLRREYVLRIVSRPGEPSGVWRIPPDLRANNYYLIVEAYAPDGTRLKLPITSEETGTVETVERWGVRVTEEVFNRIRADKADDGIIQGALIAEKRLGFLGIDYSLPVLGGTITRW